MNGRPAFRLGAYFFGGDDFDNSESGGSAELVAYAAKAQTDGEGGDAEDLVSCVTGRVYVAQSEEAFEYDADGNQTLVTTATGRWRVEYDGENRPVRWTREGDGKTVAMSYDHLGRRRTKDDQRFFYDGYLQVANERTASNCVVRQHFVWDPTETVATRPLAWVGAGGEMRVYAHDWNKNVSEVVAADADTNAAAEVLAHYDYAAFGAVVAQKGDFAEANPWRFSSEYADSDLGLVYYNYRHYDPLAGRWLTRDPIEEDGGVNLYAFCGNNALAYQDINGLAYFAKRVLDGQSWSDRFSTNATLDKFDMEWSHEQLFYGTPAKPLEDVGYFDDGKVKQDPIRKKYQYVVTDSGYDDCIMKKAVSLVKPKRYSAVFAFLPWFDNCQSYAAKLKAKYRELASDKKIQCECQKEKNIEHEFCFHNHNRCALCAVLLFPAVSSLRAVSCGRHQGGALHDREATSPATLFPVVRLGDCISCHAVVGDMLVLAWS